MHVNDKMGGTFSKKVKAAAVIAPQNYRVSTTDAISTL